MKLPIGLSDFKKLIQENYTLVDKTLFIKDIIEDAAEIILITRPRRFGKTLNLSMLRYFLQCHDLKDENIFKGLNISKHEEFCLKHQNQYPVIFITFKDVKCQKFDDAYSDILELISKLYNTHRHLLKDDILTNNERESFVALENKKATQSEIKSAIRNLSEYLHRKFNKAPVILIDEYDTPIQEAYMEGYYKEMTQLMRSMLGMALKDNSHLSKAVLTGITRIGQESLFSGLNNVEVYSLLDEKYGEYFGFTESEVIDLIAQTGNKDIKLEPIKEWYNGYQIGKHVLYNPWSILSCLTKDGKLDDYWLNTASPDLLKKLIASSKPIVKQHLEALVQGNVIERPIDKNLVFPDIDKREAALWSLLLYAGYLKVLSSRRTDDEVLYEIQIPNREIATVYNKIIKSWFTDLISLDHYEFFLKSLIDNDMEKFKDYVSSYILVEGSCFDFTKKASEQVFHVFMLGIVAGLKNKYVIKSNKESGLGRYDLALLPKDKTKNGIIIEFKTAKSTKLLLSKAQEALEQIKAKEYTAELKQHNVKLILAIGMAFCGKEVELVSEMLD